MSQDNKSQDLTEYNSPNISSSATNNPSEEVETMTIATTSKETTTVPAGSNVITGHIKKEETISIPSNSEESRIKLSPVTIHRKPRISGYAIALPSKQAETIKRAIKKEESLIEPPSTHTNIYRLNSVIEQITNPISRPLEVQIGLYGENGNYSSLGEDCARPEYQINYDQSFLKVNEDKDTHDETDYSSFKKRKITKDEDNLQDSKLFSEVTDKQENKGNGSDDNEEDIQ